MYGYLKITDCCFKNIQKMQYGRSFHFFKNIRQLFEVFEFDNC